MRDREPEWEDTHIWDREAGGWRPRRDWETGWRYTLFGLVCFAGVILFWWGVAQLLNKVT
jgi:hypothetical protein